jgi:nitrogen fixation/metabolism regulation signal transduction histidine kinase
MRVLRVEDNGPGVPFEVHARMFNPFFTTRHTGTGLGLAIVHRILDAHAGRVDIRNRSDDDPHARGAIVDLLIPDHSHDPPTGENP